MDLLLPIHISTIMTLGTPQDVTLQELRVETFFPADAESERAWMRQIATPPEAPDRGLIDPTMLPEACLPWRARSSRVTGARRGPTLSSAASCPTTYRAWYTKCGQTAVAICGELSWLYMMVPVALPWYRWLAFRGLSGSSPSASRCPVRRPAPYSPVDQGGPET
jgi:hypothetical protein